ncbi:Sucrose synthase 6 [Sarracenia purpurea var. burkii]
MAASSLMLQKPDNAMADSLSDALKQSRYHIKRCFARFVGTGRRLLKPKQIMEEMEKAIEDKLERAKVLEGLIGLTINSTQEIVVFPPNVALAVRPNPGFWEFFKVNVDDLAVDTITAKDYLKLKELIYDENW